MFSLLTGGPPWSPARAAASAPPWPRPWPGPAPRCWSATSTTTPRPPSPTDQRRRRGAAGAERAEPPCSTCATPPRPPRRSQQAAGLAGGVLNILVNNAGVIAPAMFAKMTPDQFQPRPRSPSRRHLHRQPGRAALPGRRRHRPDHQRHLGGWPDRHVGQVNYGAAKAAIVGLTKSLARELARRKITVNAVAPLAATAMTENIQQQREACRADSRPDPARPLGRTGRDRAHLRLLRLRRRLLRHRPGAAGRRRDGHLMAARPAGPFAGTGRDALIVDALRTPIGTVPPRARLVPRRPPQRDARRGLHRARWTAPDWARRRSRISSSAAPRRSASSPGTSPATPGCRPATRPRSRPWCSTGGAGPPRPRSRWRPRWSSPARTTW